MKSKYYILTIVLILIFSAGTGHSTDMFIPAGASMHLNVAQMGMGGLTTTIGTNAHTFFYNPALLNRQKFSLEIPSVGVGLDNDAIDVMNFINDHQDDFENFEDLTPEEQDQFLEDSQAFDNKWVGVQAEPYIGFAVNGLGVGAYSVTHANVKIDQGVFVPAVGMRGFMDVVIGAGIGREITIMGKTFEMGITGRYVQRRSVSPIRVSAQDANDAEDIVQTALDELEDAKTGFGVDVGMVRSMKLDLMGKGLDLDYAVVIQDLIGSLDGYIKPNVKIGAMIHMPFTNLVMIPRWDVGIEINDFFNRQGVNFFQRINIGTEVSLLSGFLKARGGFHQGYPTIGAGLSLLVIHLDYAFFTRELGSKPGQFSEGTHRAQLSFGI